MTETDGLLVLTDGEGTEVECEYLAAIEHEDKNYAIFYPTDQNEDEGEVIILEIIEGEDGAEEYVSVDDENVLDQVFAEFVSLMEANDNEE